jgi:hypothetical protein
MLKKFTSGILAENGDQKNIPKKLRVEYPAVEVKFIPKTK